MANASDLIKWARKELERSDIPNAGKNAEVTLDKTSIILTFGRSTYAAAVEGMDKAKPIMPDYAVKMTYQDFLDGKDVYMETVLKLIEERESTPQDGGGS